MLHVHNKPVFFPANVNCVYAVQIGEKIYVLHVFQKKSKTGIKTPKPDVDLIKQRYNQAQELAENDTEA